MHICSATVDECVCMLANQQNVVEQQSAAAAIVEPFSSALSSLSSLSSAITDAASGILVCTTVVVT